MAKITIIGGGWSAQLGVGLLQGGYDVTISTTRPSRSEGRVTSVHARTRSTTSASG